MIEQIAYGHAPARANVAAIAAAEQASPPFAGQALRRALAEVASSARVVATPPPDPFVVSLAAWSGPELDLLRLDDELHRREERGTLACLLLLASEPPEAALVTQVLTRYQRLLIPSRTPDLPVLRALACHRRLFTREKPLVRADYDHALDTWRWLLRLDGGASLPLQLAALFHDVERLLSEADQRREHLASDYQRFKNAHARVGSLFAAHALRPAGISTRVLSRMQALIVAHEAPNGDEELALLNDADALSFFSLNSWGFVEYFGLEHARKKVAYTLRRMRPPARRQLRSFRLHPTMAQLLAEQTAPLGAPKNRAAFARMANG